MTKRLALIAVKTGEIISEHVDGRGRVATPDGKTTVSPAVEGWQDETGSYRLVEIVPLGDVPEGKRVASRSREIEDGRVVEKAVLEDTPPPPPEPPPELTRAEKFEELAGAFGLTADDLVAEIAARSQVKR